MVIISLLRSGPGAMPQPMLHSPDCHKKQALNALICVNPGVEAA
ncbi:MAG: hypothetical protein AAGE80_03555 [Pseudomonadota bacterium]